MIEIDDKDIISPCQATPDYWYIWEGGDWQYNTKIYLETCQWFLHDVNRHERQKLTSGDWNKTFTIPCFLNIISFINTVSYKVHTEIHTIYLEANLSQSPLLWDNYQHGQISTTQQGSKTFKTSPFTKLKSISDLVENMFGNNISVKYLEHIIFTHMGPSCYE